ncbi:MAG: hypothetical protein Q7V14_00890 [Coriobacteriia bacterium]|nr:hypothetical protein [Coriobacteriia bacterium]MDO9108606.1 hypothetical protein [Coriobacteriia bacterium]
MSLSRALDSLSGDRDTQAAIRRIVALFRDHAGECFSRTKVAANTGVSVELTACILRVLGEAFVLESSGEPPTYCFGGDRANEIEIDRFLRNSGRSAGAVRNNVEKFRNRYGR